MLQYWPSFSPSDSQPAALARHERETPNTSSETIVSPRGMTPDGGRLAADRHADRPLYAPKTSRGFRRHHRLARGLLMAARSRAAREGLQVGSSTFGEELPQLYGDAASLPGRIARCLDPVWNGRRFEPACT
jgi:hypothetical protein